jgi:hypothetical protein
VAAARFSSLDIGALPLQGAPNSNLHPLVLVNRQEFGATAEQHLKLMLKQLLAAEDVQQREVGLTAAAWVLRSLLASRGTRVEALELKGVAPFRLVLVLTRHLLHLQGHQLQCTSTVSLCLLLICLCRHGCRSCCSW